MASVFPRFVCCIFLLCHNLVQAVDKSACGDWIPYGNEICVKLVVNSGFQTKEDGETLCHSFADEFHSDDFPKLVTVKTEEKQRFLQKLLFEELGTVDNIWLGLELERDGIFRWNDGTDLLFTNWINESEVEPMANQDHNCVQMVSGDEDYETGQWTKANCKKRNAVVCERTQTWTMSALQNIVLSLKKEVEINKMEEDIKLMEAKREGEEKLNEANQRISEANHRISEADQKISEANQRIHESDKKISEAKQRIAEADQKLSEANLEIANLKHNRVPINFTYVQLPNQYPPSILWPQFVWKDMSSSYAGLFFRVAGGSAAPFGQVQDSSTSNLDAVEFHDNPTKNGLNSGVNLPSDGTWSKYVYNNRDDEKGAHWWGMRFRLSAKEVRPRNQAVKVWQRIA